MVLMAGHRFQLGHKGYGGRPKGVQAAHKKARQAILRHFLATEDGRCRADRALDKLYNKDIVAYVRLVVSVLPRESERSTRGVQVSGAVDPAAIVAALSGLGQGQEAALVDGIQAARVTATASQSVTRQVPESDPPS